MNNVLPFPMEVEGSSLPYYATSWDDPVLFKIPSNRISPSPTYAGHGLVLTFEPGKSADCGTLFGEAGGIIDLNNRVCYPLNDVTILTGDPRNLPLISWSYAVEVWMKEDALGRRD